MPLVSMRQLLDEAAKGGYGVGAFNVNDMEQIQAIMEAATETQSPVIVQASRGARAYSQDRFLYHLMIAATEVYPDLPIVLHQDHGNSPATCKSAIDMGFTSVMMDGSLMEDGETPKMKRLIEIHEKLPNVHLVMHGSSSVPKDLQDIINQYGGKLKPTWGVPVEEIQLGIRNGVRKINVDTDNRLAITGAIRKVFTEKPEEFDPRSYMKPAREAMKKVVAQRMVQFGQAGHSKDYKPIPMAEMAAMYKK